jgi:hypothetical protein
VKRELLIVTLASFTTICLADGGQTLAPSAAAVATAAIASQRAARPRQVAIGTSATSTSAPSAAPATATAGPNRGATATSTSGNATNGALVATGITGTAASGPAGTTSTAVNATPGTPDPQFASEAKWVLAGYNSDEIVYTVFVTNQDPRIIRCTTEVKGFYFENGTKLSIQDRQITTVFPNQPTRVGYWMDMDQQSGASYSVKCHPV